MEELYKNYLVALGKVEAQINDLGYVQIRGEGKAAFIYASTDTRAIELSKTDKGIWVEFWDGSNEPPEFDKTFTSYETAVKAIRDWLIVD